MSLIVSGTSFHKKGEKVQDVKASILARGNRKFWYVKYQVLFQNDNVKNGEESTKVLKTEKNLKFMQQQYLPAWISRKKNELKVQQVQSFEFGFYANIFLKNYEQFHDYSNVNYRSKRILGEFSKTDIRKISKLQIKQFINNLRNSQTRDEISKNTKLKYLRIFRGIFELAKDNEIINTNIVDAIKIEGRNQRDINTVRPFTKDEVNILLQNSQDTEKYGSLLHLYLGVAFNQGMSPSEILGLQTGDVNLVNQTISIKRNITKGKIKETKTVYRDRVIPIFNSTLTFLNELLVQARLKKSIWLFSQNDGKNLNDIEDIRGESEILKESRKIKNNTKWYKLLSDSGIEHRDLKNCRHTFAVSALESKHFTMQQVANILGHSSLQMLIKHYANYISNKALDANREIDIFGDSSGDTSKNMSVSK
jgi:integrase